MCANLWRDREMDARALETLTGEEGKQSVAALGGLGETFLEWREGVSPETAACSNTPSPTTSPTTTRPVAMPTRASSLLPVGAASASIAFIMLSAARAARSASSS